MSTLLDMIKKYGSLSYDINKKINEYLDTTFRSELNVELKRCSMISVTDIDFDLDTRIVEVTISLNRVDPMNFKFEDADSFTVEYRLSYSNYYKNAYCFVLKGWCGVGEDHLKVNDFILGKLNKFLLTA